MRSGLMFQAIPSSLKYKIFPEVMPGVNAGFVFALNDGSLQPFHNSS
jgi:hypothetical protein